jgi:hypothetical protein
VLLIVAAAYATVRAVEAAGTRWLVLAGALYGLVLQTHPGTIVLAPALAATVLVALYLPRGSGAWRFLRTPWPYGAVLAGLVTYGPVLVFNLKNELSGVVRVQTRREYAYVSDPSWETYRENLTNLLFELARLISNPMRIPERPLHYLTSPYMTIMVVLALAGLALLARRGQWLPAFTLLSTAAIMPYVNKAYGQAGDRYMLTGRYVTYLLPLADVAIAVAILALSGWALRSVRRRWAQWAPAVAAAPLVLSATLVLYPLQPLGRYYTHEAGKDPANASFLEMVRIVEANRGPRTPVLVEYDLRNVDLKDGADAREIVVHLLTLKGVPHTVTQQPREDLQWLAAAAGDDPQALPLIVMMRDGCWPLRDDVPLQRVSGRLRLRELYWTVPSYFAVYRYAPPPQPAACLPPEGATPGD